MDTLVLVTVLLIGVSCTTAFFQNDIAALEKALMDEEQSTATAVKKSVQDLSTEELIQELEKEFHKENKKEANSLEKKYRKRFESIINKKEQLDQMLNADVTSLLKREARQDQVDEMIKAMADSLEDGKNTKRAVHATCSDRRSDCPVLKGYCKSHSERLRNICEKTCGWCVLPEEVPGCNETMSAAVCGVLKRMGKCSQSDKAITARMEKLCPVTCGFCKVPAAPKCSDTKHGCCWDKTTIKADAGGSNCPPCKNKYKYVCKTFKVDCDSFYKPGEFMRENCPKQCGLCGGKCADDKTKIRMCPFWKSTLHWCEKKKDLMKVFCPVTCNYC